MMMPTRFEKPRRWPLVALALPAVVSAAFACAGEAEVAPERPPEPQVIPSDAATSADVTEIDSADPSSADAGVEAGTCSDQRLCISSIPVDGRVSLVSVWGSSASDVWAVGTSGTVLHYDGAKWEQTDLEAQDASTPYTLRSVWASSADDVWITDGARIRHSTGWNGPSGTQWELFTSSTTATQPMPSAIRGKDGNIWMTRLRSLALGGAALVKLGPWVDGKPSTSQNFGPTTNISLGAIAMGRGDEAWGVGGNRILRAVGRPPAQAPDGPLTWTIEEHDSLTTKQLFGVWANESEAWVVGESGLVRRASTTGAPSFEVVESPTTKDLEDVFGFGPSDIWAVGKASAVLHWDGTSWKTVSTPFDHLPEAERPRLFAVWGSAPGDVWIAGNGTMLHLEGSLP